MPGSETTSGRRKPRGRDVLANVGGAAVAELDLGPESEQTERNTTGRRCRIHSAASVSTGCGTEQ